MSVVGARVPGDMNRRSLLAPTPAEAGTRIVREIADSFGSGLVLAWLLVLWVGLHIALGALAFAKVVLLLVSSGRRG
jgi:hypothetical protein